MSNSLSDHGFNVGDRVKIKWVENSHNIKETGTVIEVKGDYVAFHVDDFKYNPNDRHSFIGNMAIKHLTKIENMSNLKPFDLDKAISGDPVVTTQGEKAEYVCTVNNAEHGVRHIFKVYFKDLDGVDSEGIYFYLNNGKGYINISATVRADYADLLMAPKKVKYYFASWKSDYCKPAGRFTSIMHADKEWVNIHYPESKGFGEYKIHEIEIEE